MKIILATCGSRGDVQPMIALCLALNSAGHEALLIGPPEKAPWARQLNCPYQEFGRDVTAFIDTFDDIVSLSSAYECLSFVRQEIRTQFDILPALVKNADLIIGSSLMFGLSSIAQALDIPYRYIAFTPQLFPSRHHPFLTVKTQTLHGFFNFVSWKGATVLDLFNTTFLLNQYRRKMGLKPIFNAWDHILGEDPILASDPQIATVPKDGCKTVTQTGFLHLPLLKPENPALDRFLENGPKPVYAGFGSMPPKDQHKNIPILINAARRLGVRLIIAKFWNNSAITPKEEDIFFLKSYPHAHLFPQMAAVIHHGGAGTTACATLSGVPQIIVPHILDQYFHGHKIHCAGIGPRPIWRSSLAENRLIPALKACLSDPVIKQKAKALGSEINPDISMQKTIEVIKKNHNKSSN